MKRELNIAEMWRADRKPLTHVENDDLMPLPAPLDGAEKEHAWATLSQQAIKNTSAGWTTRAR